MVQLRPKIHQIFRFIHIGGIITNTWPYDPNRGKLIFILREIEWSFIFLNIIVVIVSFMFSIYKSWDDNDDRSRRLNITTIMKALSQFSSAVDTFLNLIIFKLKSTRIQVSALH